jgi:AraC family ethanolamine operon transcriptional activator
MPSTFTAQPAGAGGATVMRTVQRDPRRELVSRAMMLLRTHINEPVTMAELSRAAGVSERTMRSAFHDVVGLSPKQYAISERLRAARAALLAADPDTTTVTDIATEYGFYELGRFAGRYRHTFGEVPSRTLHHTMGRWPKEAA